MPQYRSPLVENLMAQSRFVADLKRVAMLPDALLDEIFGSFRASLAEQAPEHLRADQVGRIAEQSQLPRETIVASFALIDFLARSLAQERVSLDDLVADLEVGLEQAARPEFLTRVRDLAALSEAVKTASERKQLLVATGLALSEANVVSGLRARVTGAKPANGEITDYRPLVAELIPVISLKLERDDETEFLVELTAVQLKELITDLQLAEKDVAAATTSVSIIRGS